MRLSDLQDKDVILTSDGSLLGNIIDVEISDTGNILNIVVYNKKGKIFSVRSKEEGYIREIISKIQNMRKDSGFEVLDRINIYVAENKMLEEVIEKNKEVIMKDTLAVEIKYNENTDYTETNINGETLKIKVEKI